MPGASRMRRDPGYEVANRPGNGPSPSFSPFFRSFQCALRSLIAVAWPGWLRGPFVPGVAAEDNGFDGIDVLPAVPQAALPDDEHPPSCLDQRVLLSPVSCDVAFELFLPEGDACFRCAGVEATCVAMPVATVDEDDEPVFGKHQIRLAG